MPDLSLPKTKKNKRSLDEEIERVRVQISRLAKQPHPVVAGPFTSEVGFEILYWIPMLRWAVKEFPELEERLIVVSRGGTHDWLSGMNVRYVDILEHFRPSDFARHRALSEKQREVGEFERQVCQAVKAQFGHPEVAMLHPSLLFDSYYRFLKVNQLAYPKAVRRATDGIVEGLAARYTPITPPAQSDELAALLPEEYVAIRFYTSSSFADDAATRRFTSAVIRSVSQRHRVVLLSGNFGLDEHEDAWEELPDDIIRVNHLMRPENNLAIQTQVVGHAKAFIGTYGGYSYLAPFMGVPSLSFSMNRARTLPWHYELAERVFDAREYGAFVALRPTDLSLIGLVAQDLDLDEIAVALS